MKKNTYKLIGLAAFLIFSHPILSLGSAVFFADTGHWYEAVKVPAGITWTDANIGAVQRGGYLCTITNSSENTFAASLVDANYYSNPSTYYGDILGPWLGGFRHANDSNWQWVTGEPFNYTDWYPRQPDGYGGDEQRLQFYNNTSIGSTWGDATPDEPPTGYFLPRGYIVEYNAPPLFISQSNNVISVALPLNLNGWILTTTASLSDNPVIWSPVSADQYETNLAGIFVNITNATGNAFFRLQKN